MAKKDNTLLIIAGIAALGGAYWYMNNEKAKASAETPSAFGGIPGYANLDPAMKEQLNMLLKTGTPEQLISAANNLDAASGGPSPVSEVLRKVAAQKAAGALPA